MALGYWGPPLHPFPASATEKTGVFFLFVLHYFFNVLIFYIYPSDTNLSHIVKSVDKIPLKILHDRNKTFYSIEVVIDHC